MAGSFFTGTDAELYNGSNNFSTMISATPTAFGLSAPMAASYATLNASYAAAYEAIQVPSTRTKGAVAAKNSAKILLSREKGSGVNSAPYVYFEITLCRLLAAAAAVRVDVGCDPGLASRPSV